MKAIVAALTLLSTATVFAGHHGNILTDKSGMTLYTFDKDTAGVSNCYDGCAAKWPPFLAEDGASVKEGWSLVERKDGTKQWAYKGQPLYTWIGDKKKGDTTGDGVGGVWHTAEKSSY